MIGPYVVRFAELHIPLAADPDGLLLYAAPRDRYTHFATVEEAHAAIIRVCDLGRIFGWHPDDYEIVSVETHETEEEERHRAEKRRETRKAPAAAEPDAKVKRKVRP